MSTIAIGQGHQMRFAPVIATIVGGDNQIVAGTTGKRIIVVNYVLISVNANTAQWKSGSTPLSGAMPTGIAGGAAAMGQPSAHLFETVAGQDLVLTTGGGVGGVLGHMAYLLEV